MTMLSDSERIKRDRAERFRVLKFLYEHWHAQPGSNPDDSSDEEVAAGVGLSLEDVDKHIGFLMERDLATRPAFGHVVTITPHGVDYIERALEEPDEPSQYFAPATQILNFYGDVNSSLIQQAAGGSVQHGSVTVDTARVQMLVDELRAVASTLDAERRADLELDLATIELQIRSGRPKWAILRGSLLSAKKIIEATVGGVLADKLLAFINGMPTS